MRKSIKKTINYLKRYMGKEIIRTKPVLHPALRPAVKGYVGAWPTLRSPCKGSDDLAIFTKLKTGDYSYTDDPIILTGFTEDGRIKFQRPDETTENTLNIEFTDRSWISFNKSLKHKNNLPLSQWKGKKIVRTVPTILGVTDFMNYPLTLKAVSKHHIHGECDDTYTGKYFTTLGCIFIDGNWKLAE